MKSKKAPARKTPARKTPAKKTPAKKTPAKKTPAKKTPARKAPVKKAPVKEAPVKKAPVKKASVKKAPVKKAPVKKAPVKKAPVKKAPVKKAPAKKAPAKKTYTLRQEFSSAGTSKGAGIKSGDVERLKSLQSRFHLRFPRSNQDAFRKCLETFIPECPDFWAAVERAKSSKEEYLERLLRPENLSKRAGALNRGVRLVYSAASWTNPSVGPQENSAISRGLQWRATMAWTGCELICEGLFQRIHNCEADIVFEWCRLLELEELEDPIPPPRGLVRSSIVRNLWSEEVEILDFLDVRGGKPRRVLSEWWLRHSPIRHHGDALQASRALRDVTSHGLLSAHRVEKFGLSTVGREGGIAILERLVDVMVKVAVKTLERMG